MLHKRFIFLFGLILSFPSYGSLQSLVAEFLQQNYFLKANRQNVKEAHQIYNKLWASRTWWFDVEGGYQNNQQNDLFLQSPIDKLKGTFSKLKIEVKSDFTWGGRFNFDNQFFLHKYLVQLNQGVAYSQDLGKNFFGQTFRQELKMARFIESETKAAVDKQNQKILFRFFQLYNTARLSKTMISLHKKAKIRAIKRKAHVAKRVDAGLLEQVDLYKSVMNVITQQQQIRRAGVELARSIEGLSGLLNRQVKDEEVNAFQLDNLTIKDDMPGDTENNFALMELKQERFKITERLKKVDYSFIPKIRLDLSYKNIGELSIESQDIFQGVLGTPSYVLGASVRLFMPLGFEPEKVERTTTRIAQNRNLYKITGLKYDLKYREIAQKKRLKLLRVNVRDGIKKRKLSYKALAFQNNLYFHGRTELDIVLISERDIIITELGLSESLARMESNLAELAQIYAILKEWILTKKD